MKIKEAPTQSANRHGCIENKNCGKLTTKFPLDKTRESRAIRRFAGLLGLLFSGLVLSASVNALTVDDLNLIEVARHGDLRLFKILLARGANPNEHDDGNNTAILMAAYNSKREMTRQLIELHVDVNQLGSIGFTPVGVAAMRGDVEILKMLVNAGANLDVHDHEGETPLLIAMRAQRDENLKILLDADANADIPNNSGETPLMVAAQLGRLDYIEALLKRNADTCAKNALGETALYFAIFEGHDDIAKRLIQQGTAINGINNGYTLLHWAEAMGRQDIVPMLIESGAIN